MAKNLKSKIGSFMVSVVEKTTLAYFSNIKKNTAAFLEAVPDNTLKIYYAYILLLFLVVLGVSGLLILTIGGIFVLISLTADSIDKMRWCGFFLGIMGLLYLIISIFILKGIGSLLHSSLSRKTGKFVKNIEN